MISRKDVQHIARLARIELSAAEEATFQQELSGILSFVETLTAVDTTAALPLTGGTSLENVMRDDEPGKGVGEQEQARTLIDAAPRKREGYVEVRAVFDRR